LNDAPEEWAGDVTDLDELAAFDANMKIADAQFEEFLIGQVCPVRFHAFAIMLAR